MTVSIAEQSPVQNPNARRRMYFWIFVSMARCLVDEIIVVNVIDEGAEIDSRVAG